MGSYQTIATSSPEVESRRRESVVFLVVGLLLVAVNLRPGLTGVGPLLDRISVDVGLSATQAGLLTALPLLGFAVVSPLASNIVRRYGIEWTLFAALGTLTVGLAVRSVPSGVALFGGTVLLGAAIAIGNVLLPALVKRDFPASQGSMTSTYVALMVLVAALAAGIAVPASDWMPGGWRTALGGWALLALLAAALWLPRALRSRGTATPIPAERSRLPWRSPLAWAVTAFMGLNSLSFFVLIAWLPSVFREHGISETEAGWLLFWFQIVGLLAGLVIPVLVRRLPDQRLLAAGLSLLLLIGTACLLWVPQWGMFCSIVAGLGSGGSLIMGLTFMAMRAPDPMTAVSLSAMAQSIGYLVAAGGPPLFGLLRVVTGSWQLSIVMLCLVAAAQLAVSFFAGAGTLRPVPEPKH